MAPRRRSGIGRVFSPFGRLLDAANGKRQPRGGAAQDGDGGRHHLDGGRWEARLWSGRDFGAFRDHVARLVEIKPSRLKLHQGHHAIGLTLTQATRQEQAQLDPDSQKYADPERVIAGFTDGARELQEDLQALKASAVGHGHRREVTVRHLPGAAPAAQR